MPSPAETSQTRQPAVRHHQHHPDEKSRLAAFDDIAARRSLTGTPSVLLCDTRVGCGVPLLENREKAHFMRIDPDEWQPCRDQLTAGYTGNGQA